MITKMGLEKESNIPEFLRWGKFLLQLGSLRIGATVTPPGILTFDIKSEDELLNWTAEDSLKVCFNPSTYPEARSSVAVNKRTGREDRFSANRRINSSSRGSFSTPGGREISPNTSAAQSDVWRRSMVA